MEIEGKGVESRASCFLCSFASPAPRILHTSHALTTTTKLRNSQNKEAYYRVIIASTLNVVYFIINPTVCHFYKLTVILN